MNVTCPNCATIYRVDPAKVPAAGVRARCAVCAAVFPVRRDAAAMSQAPAVSAAAAAPLSAERTQPPAAVEAAPPPPVPAPAPPSPSAAASPAPRPAPPPVPAPAPSSPAPAPSSPAPLARREPAAAPRPDGPRPSPATPAAPRPPVARPAGLPGGAVPPRPAVPTRPAPAPAPPPPAPGSVAGATSGAGRKPVNPFLSQDPGQKARRLARALISDMVVYHPAKRREGLRDGTLKTLFEEEIKKSWEEYTDQVGKDVAESTTHFKDALNEILADGRQIF